MLNIYRSEIKLNCSPTRRGKRFESPKIYLFSALENIQRLDKTFILNNFYRKYFIFTIIVFILINMNSCVLLYPFYGIKKRTPETHKMQIEYLGSIGIDTLNVYSLKCDYIDSLSTEKFALNRYKLQYNTSASPVQFRLYDKTGKFITGWEQCFGNPKRLGYFDEIPMKPKTSKYINKTLSIRNDLNLFKITNNQKRKILKLVKSVDYVIIIFWAEWAGKFNKDAFYNIKKYIENDTSSNYLLLKLNTSPLCDSTSPSDHF